MHGAWILISFLPWASNWTFLYVNILIVKYRQCHLLDALVASPSDAVLSPADSALLSQSHAPVLPPAFLQLLDTPFSLVFRSAFSWSLLPILYLFKSILCYVGKGNLLTHKLDCFPESELNVLQWFAIVLGRGSTPLWGCEALLNQPFPPGSHTLPGPLWSSHHLELAYTGKPADWAQETLGLWSFCLRTFLLPGPVQNTQYSGVPPGCHLSRRLDFPSASKDLTFGPLHWCAFI